MPFAYSDMPYSRVTLPSLKEGNGFVCLFVCFLRMSCPVSCDCGCNPGTPCSSVAHGMQEHYPGNFCPKSNPTKQKGNRTVAAHAFLNEELISNNFLFL